MGTGWSAGAHAGSSGRLGRIAAYVSPALTWSAWLEAAGPVRVAVVDRVVLIAHPDHAHIERLADILEAAGYNCLSAHSGTEALATVAGYSPQVVIIPAELPELQGTEVCLRLKQEPDTRDTKVVLLMPDDSKEQRFVGEQVEADAMLPVDADTDALCAVLKELLG